jgi:hypothetical protein
MELFRQVRAYFGDQIIERGRPLKVVISGFGNTKNVHIELEGEEGRMKAV